ncbi:hypothetical protein FB45DRAFT_907475 [Roridomyces roridus]|uniref:E3 ubiquitin-protein ligase listerin n=1 Tax=Roridomyces roridus TaxID=1738132 RepID=A0AAD7C1V2_9AGAR|nr:hypothetical protein FB45DRAFT_907475 [Roridomyces roridus]
MRSRESSIRHRKILDPASMPPKSSSASAGTRKKHARKAAGPVDIPPPAPREKKGKKPHRSDPPRPKVYIPPSKPTPVTRDPLDENGLAHRLPPDLLVVLRGLGKKAAVTKVRALEELLSGWVMKRDEDDMYVLQEMLPVWMHHVAAHLLHLDRRIRALTASVHAALLRIPLLRPTLVEEAESDAAGAWALAAHDPDRAVATVASASRVPTTPTVLTAFLERALLDPDGLYTTLNPTAPVALPPPNKGGRGGAARPTGRVEPEPVVRRTDELEESESDRRARFRIAAFGALRHMLETMDAETPLPAFLSVPRLWSALNNTQDDADPEEPIGYAQPALRRAAWAVIPALLQRISSLLQDEGINELRDTLARAVLQAAWVEQDGGVQGAMWGGVLGVLRNNPGAWHLTPSAYPSFLTNFLAKACGGAPVSAYPSVVLVVASLPDELIVPTDTLFDAFWAALGGPPSTPSTSSAAPALTTALPGARARAGAAFVSALLECAVFVVRRGRGRAGVASVGEEGDAEEEEARRLLAEETQGTKGSELVAREVSRVWAALSSASPEAMEQETERRRLLHVDTKRAGVLLRQALEGAAGVGSDLLDAGLDALGRCIKAGWAASGDGPLVCAVLAELVGEDREEANDDESAADGKLSPAVAATRIHAFGRALTTDILSAALATEEISTAFLVCALSTFGARTWTFGDGAVAERADAMFANGAYALLRTAPGLLFAYLRHRALRREELYQALLREVAKHPEAAGDALAILVSPEAGVALEGLKATDGLLDSLFVDVDAGAQLQLPPKVLAQVLQQGERFLTPAAGRAVLARVVAAFVGRLEVALANGEQRVPLGEFEADVTLLGEVLAVRPDALSGLELGGGEVVFAPAVYIFGYVLPRAYPEEERDVEALAKARSLWTSWCEVGDEGSRAEVRKEIIRRLCVMVCSTDVAVTPEDILEALGENTFGAPIDVVTAVFPSRPDLDGMLDVLSSDPPAASLAVLHPHLPPSSAIRKTKPASAHDTRGYSSYARTVIALLQALAADRRVAKENVWALHHVLALAIYAEDHLAVPSAPSAVFDATLPTLDRTALADLVVRAQQLSAYLLSAGGEDGWRARVLAAVTNDKPLVGGGALPELLVGLIGCARRTDGILDCRVLDRVLRHVLQDADKAEADLWMVFARKIEKTTPETCIAIVSAVSNSTLEPPRLERYRNELAADLLGIPASKANTQGLLTLRKLAASAPDVDSDVVFLPQQRSVNIFKACQQWIASDEDIEEELESAMTLVFLSLAPLLQNVVGTHWDLIFDVLESNLENASLTDEETLVSLARTLRLIILIQDLTLTNKTLRASWQERQMPILTLVRDLAAGQPGRMQFGSVDDLASSAPLSLCRERVLFIVQDLPASLITEETLPQMCHLLTDPSIEVQKMTYQLLGVAARKRTEHFVIEAGVDVDAVVKAELPLELLDILQTSLNSHQGDLLELDESTVFGYLLGWMVVFDLFTDASLKVRLSYIDQLRSLDIIGSSFIPNLLNLLGVDQGIGKAFKLDPWSVDEYFVQLYESGSPWSFQVFAAHLYYRALLTVPSLIYNWVLDCKDRQLSSSIATYTSLHFSPVIIRSELTHVKSPQVTADLVDENLTIKVAAAVNEVVASYLVDEHQLEIKLKIPSDWPLHKIEVKDVQKVGVEERRWRAWILAVQQILWSQNGRIVDGIGLFKKNVTLHFEGQVECAICYSIISVMDGSLPSKPCKTCKNRFHSGCLYKWFSTSHSSSCPLCRSDII